MLLECLDCCFMFKHSGHAICCSCALLHYLFPHLAPHFSVTWLQDDDDPEARYMVRLRALRHPLLYGDHLKQRQVLERQAAMEGSRSSSGGGGAGAGAAAKKGRSGARLSNRRDAMMKDAGLNAPAQGPGEGETTAQVRQGRVEGKGNLG